MFPLRFVWTTAALLALAVHVNAQAPYDPDFRIPEVPNTDAQVGRFAPPAWMAPYVQPVLEKMEMLRAVCVGQTNNGGIRGSVIVVGGAPACCQVAPCAGGCLKACQTVQAPPSSGCGKPGECCDKCKETKNTNQTNGIPPIFHTGSEVVDLMQFMHLSPIFNGGCRQPAQLTMPPTQSSRSPCTGCGSCETCKAKKAALDFLERSQFGGECGGMLCNGGTGPVFEPVPAFALVVNEWQPRPCAVMPGSLSMDQVVPFKFAQCVAQATGNPQPSYVQIAPTPCAPPPPPPMAGHVMQIHAVPVMSAPPMAHQPVQLYMPAPMPAYPTIAPPSPPMPSTEVHRIQLHKANATQMALTLQRLLLGTLESNCPAARTAISQSPLIDLRISVDDRANTLTVAGSPNDVLLAEAMVGALDESGLPEFRAVACTTPTPTVKHAHLSTPDFEAHCQKITHHGDTIVLEGDVLLMCKKHAQPIRIEAQRVVVNMKDGTFTVDSEPRRVVADVKEQVERTLNDVNRQMAERDLKIAEYYQRTGHPGAACFQYQLIAERYPGTCVGDKAAKCHVELLRQSEINGNASGFGVTRTTAVVPVERAAVQAQRFQAVRLRHHQAQDIVKTMTRLLGNLDGVTLQAEPISNSILVSATPDHFEAILALISGLDQPR